MSAWAGSTMGHAGVRCGPHPYIVGQALKLYQHPGAYDPATPPPPPPTGRSTMGHAGVLCGPQPYSVGHAFQLYQQWGA